MTWLAYRVTFRLLSPMHIGWRKIGNLQQTRSYVTGRNMWGAMTERLARDQAQGRYQEIGRQVDEELAFTYFYPSTTPDEVSLWPWSEGRQDEFAWTFLGSYSSTALVNGRNAEEGSLHETEFIAPYTRHQESSPVYLVGYIFAKDTCRLLWQHVLDRLQLGGERSYGWGRVCLKGDPVQDALCFGYELILKEARPLIIVSKGKTLLAHTDARKVEGDGLLEPFIGRETANHTRFGKTLTQASICWMPGSLVSKEEKMQILARGIWASSLEE